MNLVDQLKRDEAFRSKAYHDTEGKLTIGYGRNLDDNGIRQSEGEVMLANDIAEVEGQLHAYLPWTDGLDEARRGVLLNMAYNMGIVELLHFKQTLALVHDGDYEGAAKAMLESKWADEVGPRAHRLALQMKIGEWQ